MSTKLYNGIKFKSRNIREVLDQLISIRKIAIEKAIDMITESDLEDFIIANGLLEQDSWEISREASDAIENSSHSRFKFIPRIRFSIVVYPTVEGDIYGYYFNSDREEFMDLLDPIYTDFHYQDQSDPPIDISQEDWEFREKKWDELIDYKFKDTGLTFDFVSGSDLDIFDLRDKVESVLDKIKRNNKIDSVI